MESLYKRKMFASMRKTKVAASKKRQIGLPASILDDSDEGSFSSSSSSGSQSDFQSSPEDDSDDSSSSSSRGDEDEEDDDDDDDEEDDDGSHTKRMVQPRKRSRLQRQDESDSDRAEEKRKEDAEKAKRRQRHNKLLALSRRMKARIPSRRRSRVKQVHLSACVIHRSAGTSVETRKDEQKTNRQVIYTSNHFFGKYRKKIIFFADDHFLGQMYSHQRKMCFQNLNRKNLRVNLQDGIKVC
uniref:Uncharacterized protein n=1 Tax=Astatotilapia calliptera TaxID=8154 RepID=A0AAX7T315_ASTCA